MCSRTREISKNKVKPDLWDTLYIQFSYNITLYLTVLCRAAPALNQNLRSRAGAALTPIFRLRAALQVHIWHSERPSALNLYMVLRACPAFNPYFAFRAPLCSEALNTKYGPAFNTKYSLKAGGRSECQIWVESRARSQHHIELESGGALWVPNMGWKRGGHAFNTIYSLKAGGGALRMPNIAWKRGEGRSECQIWVESGARFQHHI